MDARPVPPEGFVEGKAWPGEVSLIRQLLSMVMVRIPPARRLCIRIKGSSTAGIDGVLQKISDDDAKVALRNASGIPWDIQADMAGGDAGFCGHGQIVKGYGVYRLVLTQSLKGLIGNIGAETIQIEGELRILPVIQVASNHCKMMLQIMTLLPDLCGGSG